MGGHSTIPHLLPSRAVSVKLNKLLPILMRKIIKNTLTNLFGSISTILQTIGQTNLRYATILIFSLLEFFSFVFFSIFFLEMFIHNDIHSTNATSTLGFIFLILIILLNILFFTKKRFENYVNEFSTKSKKTRIIWITTTLLFGFLPLLLIIFQLG